MKTQLTLNVVPIDFDDAGVEVAELPYESDEQMRELRDKHQRTHVFKRVGSSIVYVAVADGAPKTVARGSEMHSRRVLDNLPLVASLASHALLENVYESGRSLTGYRPIKISAKDESSNLLLRALPREANCPAWLAVRPLYELEFRVFRPDRQPPFVGMAMNVRTTRFITATCAELLDGGMNIDGLYVGRRAPFSDVRMDPRFELLGKVRSASRGVLTLDDARPGCERVSAADAFLETRGDGFARCMSHAFGRDAYEAREDLEAYLARFRSGPTRLNHLRRAVEHFASQGLRLAPRVPFRFTEFLAERRRNFPPAHVAPAAVYVFDPSGTSTKTWHDGGLDLYGPYSAGTFTPTRPKICVICQKSKKGRVDQFLNKFLRGIPQAGSGRAPFAKGFVRKYELEGATTEFFTTDDDTVGAYKRAVRQALEHHGEQGPKWNLALVQIDGEFHDLPGRDNPYLITKAAFLKHQIPTQEFTIETVDLPNKRLAYALNNMALATYTKINGVPWLIKADRAMAHELVIGLGSARIGEGRLGGRERVVGITTVFTGDGHYCVTNVSKVVPMADYEHEMLETLRKSVDQVRADMNWQRREPVRLVFHAFKPLKDAETEAVKRLMAELGDYDVDYAFLHVVEDHPYLLFDEAQEGMRDFESGMQKGVLAPQRGLFFRISGKDVLIALTGPKDVKRAQDGIPRPVLLSLHRNSTFEDTTYLARQVFTFASHSWRSFFPSPLPVTILYSELIAKLLGELSKLPNWDPDAMLGRIGRTRWFL